MTFAEIKKDYIRLIKEHYYPYDMDGGFVQSEKMEKVILNPTKKGASNYMATVIAYGFQWGKYYRSELHGEQDIEDYPFLKYLYEKYRY